MAIFRIGGPVTGKDFYGREEVLKMLYNDIVEKGMLGYVVYGQRRIGKTSLLEEFAMMLGKKKSVTPIYFDVSSLHPFDIETFHDQLFLKCVSAFEPKKEIISRIADALKGSADALVKLVRSGELSAVIKDYLQIRVGLKEKKTNLQDLIKKSFGVPESLGKETKTRAVLILDEFQMVDDLEENTVWAIRSIIQEWKSASIIVCGSEVSLLEQMIFPKTAPFYQLLKPYQLGPFDEKTSMKMMKERFRLAGLSADDKVLKYLYNITDGYPYYLQWLGDKIYDSGKKKIEKDTVDLSLNALLKEGDPLFRSSLEKLSSLEKDTFIEIGLGNEQMSKIALAMGKPISTIAKMLERLIEKSFVRKKAEGEYTVIDPILKKWIAATYR